jgi:hypothetical protein
VIRLEGEFAVTVGSKYRVDHGNEDLTTGIFKGYSAMGTDTAMVFQLEDGTLRFINLAQIVYLDLLEDAPKKQSKKKDSGSVYYG